MIPNEMKKTKPLVTVSLTREVETRLSDDAKVTGNKSYIVERALRQYFGMSLDQDIQEEKLAS
jgi:hypothetical protein